MESGNRRAVLANLLAHRQDIHADRTRQAEDLETMPTGVQVWFNVACAQIINAWNGGSPAIMGADLLHQTVSVVKTEIPAHEWARALATFCAPDVQGPMNFLLYAPTPDTYIINYPAVARFIDSGLGTEWMPALEMFFGLRVAPLRQPEPGLEREWCDWLEAREADRKARR